MNFLASLSVRTRLLLLVGMALLPLTGLAVAGLVELGRQQHVQAQRALLERARAIASAVDLELYGSIAALKVLALSASLHTGDLARFHGEAKPAVEARPDWDGFILLDAQGRRLLNTRVPFGQPLPGGAAPVEGESLAALLATGGPVIGNIAKGPGGHHRFPVRVPVLRDGALRYVLTALAKPDLLVHILQRQKVPAESVSTIFDARRRIVARSRNHEDYLGGGISDSLARLIADAGEGSGVTVTREGQEVYTAFSRSERSGWGVALGVPRDVIDAPIWRSYGLSAAGLLLSVTLGGLLAAGLARRIVEERMQQLERANTELAFANQELEAFSYSVAHDLRSPLRAIDGNAALVLMDHGESLPEEARGQLDRVRASAARMARLIDDLLAFARITRQQLARERVDTSGLVEECLETVRRDLGTAAPDCILQRLPACDADPALLRQALLNLIGNAFKYTRKTAAPRIEVGWEKRDGEDVFFIRDNGAGFDMAHAGKLFGVFQRLHSKEEFEGTGIGLAIVERIIRRHGGRIWAWAEPGKGATFYFTLQPRASKTSGGP